MQKSFEEQTRLSREDLKVRHQLIYEEKWDSQAIITERKKLAEQLLDNAPMMIFKKQ